MCCLFGILDFEHRLNNTTIACITSALSIESEARGTDACGISYLNHDNLTVYKRPLPANRMKFRIPKDCHIVMGHTRLTTQGNERYNRNNHPFIGRVGKTSFALAHNGILRNDKQLRVSEKLPYTNIQTDSFVAVQLIEKKKTLSFDSLRYMAEKVKGSFCFSVLDRTGLYLIKGDNPLCIYKFYNLGFYVYASTEIILKNAVIRLGLQEYEHEEVKIKGGDILKLKFDGQEERGRFEFDDYEMWDYGFKPYRGFSNRINEKKYDDWSYWDELKSLSGYFGYTPDDIDKFQAFGLLPEIVEEILYCGETEKLTNDCFINERIGD